MKRKNNSNNNNYLHQFRWLTLFDKHLYLLDIDRQDSVVYNLLCTNHTSHYIYFHELKLYTQLTDGRLHVYTYETKVIFLARVRECVHWLVCVCCCCCTCNYIAYLFLSKKKTMWFIAVVLLGGNKIQFWRFIGNYNRIQQINIQENKAGMTFDFIKTTPQIDILTLCVCV